MIRIHGGILYQNSQYFKNVDLHEFFLVQLFGSHHEIQNLRSLNRDKLHDSSSTFSFMPVYQCSQNIEKDLMLCKTASDSLQCILRCWVHTVQTIKRFFDCTYAVHDFWVFPYDNILFNISLLNLPNFDRIIECFIGRRVNKLMLIALADHLPPPNDVISYLTLWIYNYVRPTLTQSFDELHSFPMEHLVELPPSDVFVVFLDFLPHLMWYYYISLRWWVIYWFKYLMQLEGNPLTSSLM